MNLRYEPTYGYESKLDNRIFKERDEAKAHDLQIALGLLGFTECPEPNNALHKALSFLVSYINEIERDQKIAEYEARRESETITQSEE